MQLIDRYILKLFLLYLVAGLVVFVTLYLTVDSMSFAVRNSQAGAGPIILYYLYQTPWIIYQLIPVACLMATLFTLSTLNRTHELTALYSIGMGLRRVCLPIFGAVIVVSAVAFVVGDQVLPRLLQKRNYVEYVEIKKHPSLYSTVKTNKIWYRSENVLFNIKTLNPEKAKAQDITLYYFDPQWDLTQLIAANEVDMKGNLWTLKDGLVTLFAPESSFPLTQSFKVKTITMNEDLSDIKSTSNSSEIMSLSQLDRFIRRNQAAGLDTVRYQVDYQAKFGFAFAALVMCMVAVPFSVASSRAGGTFFNLGICLGLAFVYWISYSSGIALGHHGVVPPVIAAWGPNFLGTLTSFYLFSRLKR